MTRIFIHIPKTGGTTVIKNSGLELQTVSHAAYHKNYVSLEQKRKENPEAIAFAFIRNPLDRFLSAYYYLKNYGTTERDKTDGQLFIDPYEDVNEFVSDGLAYAARKQTHFRPQKNYLDSRVILYPYENLQSVIDVMRENDGLTQKRLPRSNKSKRPKEGSEITKESVKAVKEIYKSDVDLYLNVKKNYG